MKSVSLAVSQIERVTADSVKISFVIPQELKFSFDFFAGQYISLEKEIEGKLVRRAYSICSSPYEDVISVAIKQIPNGLFSTYACEQLQVGDLLEVFPPEGKFAYIPEISPENLGLFAAGSGITWREPLVRFFLSMAIGLLRRPCLPLRLNNSTNNILIGSLCSMYIVNPMRKMPFLDI